jgi:hypothetical protein
MISRSHETAEVGVPTELTEGLSSLKVASVFRPFDRTGDPTGARFFETNPA